MRNSPAEMSASSGARSDAIGRVKNSASPVASAVERSFSTTLFRMRIETFALERFQSIWENRVAWNVSESGVHPMRVVDLVDTPTLHDALLDEALGYPQTNGTIELREAIAAMYPGAAAAHVQVTNGRHRNSPGEG